MATNDIAIINNALALIGVPAINSLSDPINAAKVANQIYGQSRDAVLRMHTWGFATKRATLSLIGSASFGPEKRFTLPAGCLRIVELYNSTSDWKIENGEFLTPDSTAQVKYIYQETDTTKYDSLFTEALEYYLASKMAVPLTQSQDKANQMAARFQQTLALAKSVDANEDAPIEIISRALLVLGAPPIVERDDTRLQIASKIYEKTRDEVLAAHPWNFALKRSAALTGTTAVFGFAYAYTLPADCLRVLEVYNGTSNAWSNTSWRVEGGVLLTDESTAKIRYIAQITDTTKFSASYMNALVYNLAAKLAGALTNQSALIQPNYELYQKTLMEARLADNQEGGTDIIVGKALLLLGINSIATLDGEKTQLISETYKTARDEVLKAHPWNFAIKRSGALTAGTAPSFEYSNSWTLPADCLRVLEVYDSTGAWSSASWRVEAGAILCNLAAAPKVKYIAQITDTTKFSAEYTNALVYNLAAKLASALANQPALIQPNYELYQKTLIEARLADNQEGGADIIVGKALLLLGVNSLAALDGEKAQLINETYKTARDEALKAHPWNFAVKRSGALTAGSAPSFEYTNSWTLPADCLRVLEVYDNTGAWSSSSWRVESGALLCNLTLAPKIKYIAQITDAAKFSPEYTNALVYNLASKLAPALGQPNLLQPNYELYQKTILEARFVDDKEGGSDIIIAKALVLLGVTSLDEHKTQLAIKLYEDTRNEVLRAHTWNFAMKRSGALTTTTAPSFGFTYAYTLPADCLRVVELYNSTSPWRVENSLLLTNDATAKIKYIAQITDTAKFSANFINALVYNLASKLAFPIANQPAMTQTYYESYKNTINEARLVDSTEGVPVTDIVNQSLALIGVSSIAALDDNQIRVVEKLYTPTLMETLADHEWNFAISRATLTEATPAPTFGYAHKYTLPSDCLRVVELYDSDSEWKVEGGYLLTDDATARIIYIANITDTTKFSPLFTTALQYHLASKFAVPMAKDKGLQKQNYDLYRATIDNARSVDSREGTADDITSNALIEARR